MLASEVNFGTRSSDGHFESMLQTSYLSVGRYISLFAVALLLGSLHAAHGPAQAEQTRVYSFCFIPAGSDSCGCGPIGSQVFADKGVMRATIFAECRAKHGPRAWAAGSWGPAETEAEERIKSRQSKCTCPRQMQDVSRLYRERIEAAQRVLACAKNAGENVPAPNVFLDLLIAATLGLDAADAGKEARQRFVYEERMRQAYCDELEAQGHMTLWQRCQRAATNYYEHGVELFGRDYLPRLGELWLETLFGRRIKCLEG